jgi:hypothetical protein
LIGERDRPASIGAERYIIAERTAAAAYAAVAVRTGKTGIDGDLVYMLAITRFHILAKGVYII